MPCESLKTGSMEAEKKNGMQFSIADVGVRRRFIVSVGSSLILNYNRKMKNGSRSCDAFDLDEKDESKKLESLARDSKLYRPVHKLLENLSDTSKASKAGFSSPPKLSAELSSLLLPPDPVSSQDAVTLVRSDTLSTEICAKAVCKLLKSMVPCLVEPNVVVLSNIRGASDPDFAGKGLPQLVNYLDEIIDQANNDEEEVILVPTGGYKALIPYYVVMGILHRKPCRYVYEESNRVMSLLHVPLHVDLAAWSAIESILATLEGQESSWVRATDLYLNNQHALDSLLAEDDGATGTPLMKRTKLADRFAHKVQLERGQPELVYRTHNSPLLDYLDDELRKKFLRLADLGPLFWKGDRVPEMADHALLHHADLFSIAERVLLPMFIHLGRVKPFLESEELFALLCALHLHDCGHVLGKVDLANGTGYRLLPTEVREFHHILGYLRLKRPNDHGGTGRWIYDHLKSSSGLGTPWGCNDSDVWTAYLGAAAVLGLFHRKKMKIEERTAYQFIPQAKLPEIPPLKDFVRNEPLLVRGKGIDFKRIKLLVCLLRIIDSLDEQASRVGDEQERQFHINLIKMQASEEERRAAGMKSILEELLKPDSKWCALNNALGVQITKEADIPSAAELYRSWQAAQKSSLEKHLLDLTFEYAYSVISNHFKRFQEIPFEIKSKIRMIEIKPNYADSHLKLSILVQSDDISAKESILKSLREEYEVTEKINGSDQPIVGDALRNVGVILEYA